jgi:DivIVA domain-containing protein
MRRKRGTDHAPATGARITPEEVQQVEFRLAFRGYNERDVDAFLDRITEGLSSYLEELERLRPVVGQPLQIRAPWWLGHAPRPTRSSEVPMSRPRGSGPPPARETPAASWPRS